MKRQLDLILNGKGGVGKSFFAVNLVQFLKDKAVPFVGCDTDNENSTLKRFHSDRRKSRRFMAAATRRWFEIFSGHRQDPAGSCPRPKDPTTSDQMPAWSC